MKSTKNNRPKILSGADFNLLRKEADDPISFMDARTYKAERRKIIIRGLTALTMGLAFLIIMPIFYGRGELNNTGTPRNNSSGGVFVTFALIIYGIYQLLHINKQVESNRRNHLTWLYPELKTPQQPKTKKQIFLDFVLNHLMAILVTLMTISVIYLVLSN